MNCEGRHCLRFNYITTRVSSVTGCVPTHLATFLVILYTKHPNLLEFMNGCNGQRTDPGSNCPRSTLTNVLGYHFKNPRICFKRVICGPFVKSGSQFVRARSVRGTISVGEETRVLVIVMGVIYLCLIN